MSKVKHLAAVIQDVKMLRQQFRQKVDRVYDHLKENNQTCEKEATIREWGIASSGDDVQPAKEQHRRTFLT